MGMREVTSTPPILRGYNTASDGVGKTVKAVYYKVSCANFLRTDGTGATGVMVVYETV